MNKLLVIISLIACIFMNGSKIYIEFFTPNTVSVSGMAFVMLVNIFGLWLFLSNDEELQKKFGGINI